MSYAMRDDISDAVLSLGALAPFERERGIDETMGYYFFQENVICLAAFELMLFNCDCKWELIDKAALMNAIWANFPDYAVAYNQREQFEKNDGFGEVMQYFDPDYKLNRSVENMIVITPDAGADFLIFSKMKKDSFL